MSRFVVEVEADCHSADFFLGYLKGYLKHSRRITVVRKVEAGSIQSIVDEAHALRDRLEG